MPPPGTAARIAAALAAFQPDVVHISFSFSLLDKWLLAHCRRQGIRTVATVHLPYARDLRRSDHRFQALFRFHAQALSAADRCIALSSEQRDLLLSVGCAPGQIAVIPNGVDTDEVVPGPSNLRAIWGGDFTIGYLGRLDPEKRVLDLVHSFQRQAWAHDSRLVIAGSGVQEQRIRRIAAADPRIITLGAIHDRQRCIEVLRGIDAFVLPSTVEGLSLSLLEAMAAGCAVVATDVGDDGALVSGAGMMLPAHPLEPSLTQALTALHGDPSLRNRLGKLARERVVDSFSIVASIDALMRQYEELLGRSQAVA